MSTEVEALNTKRKSIGGKNSKFRKQSNKGSLEMNRAIRKFKIDLDNLEKLL